MDAIDILGKILQGQSQGSGSGGGMGGRILKEIIAAGRRSLPQAESQAPAPGRQSRRAPSGGRSPSPSSSPPSGTDIGREARQLEEFLNVGRESSAPSSPPRAGSGSTTRSAPRTSGHRDAAGGSSPEFEIRTESPDARSERQKRNEEAMILIRAMVNAAKSDGRIARDEQARILDRISGGSDEIADVLRREFDAPLDVREFAWSVPIGLEQKVYMLSLAAIDLDTEPEAGYLRDLAHGLRLPPEARTRIHRELGAPAPTT